MRSTATAAVLGVVVAAVVTVGCGAGQSIPAATASPIVSVCDPDREYPAAPPPGPPAPRPAQPPVTMVAPPADGDLFIGKWMAPGAERPVEFKSDGTIDDSSERWQWVSTDSVPRLPGQREPAAPVVEFTSPTFPTETFYEVCFPSENTLQLAVLNGYGRPVAYSRM